MKQGMSKVNAVVADPDAAVETALHTVNSALAQVDASAAERAVGKLIAAVEESGAVSVAIADRLRALLRAVSMAAAELYSTTDARLIEARAKELARMAVSQRIVTEGIAAATRVAEGEQATPAAATEAAAAAKAELDEKGLVGAAEDLQKRVAEGHMTVDEIKAAIESFRKTDGAKAALDLVTSAIASGDGSDEGGHSLAALQETVYGELASALASRAALQARAEKAMGRELAPAEQYVVEEAVALWDTLGEDETFGSLAGAAASAYHKGRKYTEELERASDGSTELSVAAATRTFNELRALLKEEEATALAAAKRLAPAGLALAEAAAAILCNDVLPSLELPRINGLADSPIGRIGFHAADLSFSSVSVHPSGLVVTLPELGEGGGGIRSGGERLGSAGIRGIGMSIEGLRWQFAKTGYPYMPRDDGRARVAVSGLGVVLQYSIRLEGKKLVIGIRGVRVDVDAVEVKIANAKGSDSVMYNLIIGTLQKRIVKALRDNVVLQLGGAVDKVARLIAPYADGFLALQHDLDLPKPEPVFVSPYHIQRLEPGPPHVLDDMGAGHFKASIPNQPRCVYLSAHEEPPAAFVEMAQAYGAGMLFGFVPGSQRRVQREFGVLDTASLPTVVLIPHSGEGGAPRRISSTPDQPLSKDAVRSLLAPFCWADGGVVSLDESTNADALLSRPMPHVLVVYITNQEKTPEALTTLASHLGESAEPPVLFASVHAKAQPALAERLGATSLPHVVAIPPSTARAPSLRGAPVPLDAAVTPRNIAELVASFGCDYKAGSVQCTERNLERFFQAKANRWKVLVIGDQAERTGAAGSIAAELFAKFGKKLVIGYCGGAAAVPIRRRFGAPATGPAAVAALGHALVDVGALLAAPERPSGAIALSKSVSKSVGKSMSRLFSRKPSSQAPDAGVSRSGSADSGATQPQLSAPPALATGAALDSSGHSISGSGSDTKLSGMLAGEEEEEEDEGEEEEDAAASSYRTLSPADAAAAETWRSGGVPFVFDLAPQGTADTRASLVAYARRFSRLKVSKRVLKNAARALE